MQIANTASTLACSDQMSSITIKDDRNPDTINADLLTFLNV
jgi:hypothetical protein